MGEDPFLISRTGPAVHDVGNLSPGPSGNLERFSYRKYFFVSIKLHLGRNRSTRSSRSNFHERASTPCFGASSLGPDFLLPNKIGMLAVIRQGTPCESLRGLGLRMVCNMELCTCRHGVSLFSLTRLSDDVLAFGNGDKPPYRSR